MEMCHETSSPPHPTPRPPTNPPSSSISFTVCFLQRFCRLALLVGYKSMISIFQVMKTVIRINAWRGIYGSRDSGVQLSKRDFFNSLHWRKRSQMQNENSSTKEGMVSSELSNREWGKILDSSSIWRQVWCRPLWPLNPEIAYSQPINNLSLCKDCFEVERENQEEMYLQ